LTPQPEVAEPQVPRVSVVIVSFNRVEILRQSLQMLGDTHRVIVVDNGSWDGAAMLSDEFPNARFSRLPKNFGMVKALNIGLRSADGEYILCLHDDTLITGEAVSGLADYLESRPEVGAVAPLLTDSEGKVAAQSSALPKPSAPQPSLVTPPEGGEVAVECVSSAAIMFRGFFLRALRQVDERYGNYGTGIEICAQMRRASKKVVILRSLTAVHLGLPSPAQPNLLEADRAAGTAVFIGKHHGFMSGLMYRLRAGLAALFGFRFSALAGAISGQKIDGAG
jgi:GT2 family glycosyltransferase